MANTAVRINLSNTDNVYWRDGRGAVCRTSTITPINIHGRLICY